jgi:hypothetical protein
VALFIFHARVLIEKPYWKSISPSNCLSLSCHVNSSISFAILNLDNTCYFASLPISLAAACYTGGVLVEFKRASPLSFPSQEYPWRHCLRPRSLWSQGSKTSVILAVTPQLPKGRRQLTLRYVGALSFDVLRQQTLQRMARDRYSSEV